MNAFEVLGLRSDASQDEVRAAYRSKAKGCHPDLFENQEDQAQAQEKMIRLNLAYEEAMRLVGQNKLKFSTLPTQQVLTLVRKLMDQGQLETALGQMSRADDKNGAWYCLQGQLLMKLKQYASAHQAFRAAVRYDPVNNEYRTYALDAALAVKKHQKLHYRLADWAENILSLKRK